jgi:hypothetical protein
VRKTVLCVIAGAALLGVPAGAAQPQQPRGAKTPPASPSGSSPVLDLERWLKQRWQSLGNRLGPDDRDRTPRGPRYDTPGDTSCDPSRTKCPIG